MTTTDEIYGSALRILRMAAKHPIQPIYQDTRESARGLADNGYLEPFGVDKYRITQKGWDYLGLRPAVKPRALKPVANDPPRKRVTTQKPQPPEMHNVLQSVRYGDLRMRQKEMLRFIDRWLKDIGYPPTIREIGDAVGITSTSVIRYNLTQLISSGWLERTNGVSRGIRLCRDLPGSKTKHEIYVDQGLLKITVNFRDKPQAVIDAAQEAVKRLQEVIATAQQS